MATANVVTTPKETVVTPRRPRLKRPPRGLLLRDSDENESFTTLDLVNGLHGVCLSLDELFNNQADIQHAHCLAMAAMVLSTMVADRVEI